jgi:glyoxylase-like metal-dependent hydrolase (beta-lactamase superfamily II)/8-oxo-dGTP pyrophosphatase MutT (NUDIX family)
MVVRDGDHPTAPLEVLMLRRNVRSDFVGGAYVFPGGALDAADGGPAAVAVCAGRDDASASRVLGLRSGGLAYWVAAARECFEEAGLLLASRDTLSFAEPQTEERFARHRGDLNAGRRTFPEMCREEGLVVPADRMHYFAHWVTPEGSPRRYDTRFFVAAAPVGQTPTHDAAETVADVWIRPADALALHREGRMELILPTIRTLQAIARFDTVAQLLEAAEGAGDVPTMAPRMVMDDEGVRLLLPGDPGYDDPALGPPPAAGAVLAAAALAASRRANPPAAPPPMPDTARGPDPVPGRLDALVPGLARLTAPNPGVMTGPGTNTYLVGSGDLAVVDPGPDDPGHVASIEAAAAGAGGTIRWILVTHTHPDHAPGARRLADRTGAQVVGFGSRDGFVPDVEARDGWALEAPSFRLTALHTPGHASNHLCWLLEEPRILLSGDHVMDRVTVVIAPPDGDMSAYLTSLRRLLAIDPPIEAIAPGHGRLLGTAADVVSGIIAHRLAREELVLSALAAAGTATVGELVARVYADVDPAVHPIARASLWAHLRKLAEDGRAIEVAGEPGTAYRAVAPGSLAAAGS